MKGILLTLGAAVALVASSGTASAQRLFPGDGHNHGHPPGYPSGGWGGGHYHYRPAHTHYHPDPFGGHLHYHPGRPVYHRGPDYFPAPVYRPYGYGGYGPRYQPGVSFGFSVVR